MRPIRTVRRVGGAAALLGFAFVMTGKVALTRDSVDVARVAFFGGGALGVAGLFTLAGAQARLRRARAHLGAGPPFPPGRGRRLRVAGGVLLGLAGVVVGGAVLGRGTSSADCNPGGVCELRRLSITVPAVLGSVFTTVGVALLSTGLAVRWPTNGRVRWEVSARQGVPVIPGRF